MITKHFWMRLFGIGSKNIKWDNVIGQSYARCIKCNRKLKQEETKITFHSQSGGDVRASGKVWCKVCGSTQRFDTRGDMENLLG